MPEIQKTWRVTFAQNLNSVKLRGGLCHWAFSKSTRDLKSSNTAKKVQEDWKASKNYLQEKLQQSNYSRYLVFRNDLDLSKKDSFAFTGH